MNLKMRSMVFEDSLFEECYFEDITSSNTFFKNCTFIATLFYNTGKCETCLAEGDWLCVSFVCLFIEETLISTSHDHKPEMVNLRPGGQMWPVDPFNPARRASTPFLQKPNEEGRPLDWSKKGSDRPSASMLTCPLKTTSYQLTGSSTYFRFPSINL